MNILLDPIIQKINSGGGIYRYWADLEDGFSKKNIQFEKVKLLGFDQKARLERFLYFSTKQKELDIIHSSYYRLPILNKNHNTKVVITAYDCIHELFRGGLALKTHVFSKKRALENCHHVISISESTKNDLIQIYNIAHSKISVCHLNVNNIFLKPSKEECSSELKFLKKQNPFFLFVGGRQRYKNFDLAVNAVKELHNTNLVICGSANFSNNEINMLKQNLKNRFFFFKNIDDKSLKWLYQNSIALLYPSEIEGFGLPPLECILSGGKTIVQNTSSLKEILPKNYPGLSKFKDYSDYKHITYKLFYNKINKIKWNLSPTYREHWSKYSWINNTLKIYKSII